MSEPTANAEHESAPKILFLHLPKTAGSALRELFAKQYGGHRVTLPLPTQRLDEALIRYADYDVISGHFHPEHGTHLPADRLALTVLRDPIERFLSYYNFRKYDVSNGLVDPRVRRLPLDAYVESLGDGDIRELNAQTHMLYPLGTDAMHVLPWPERAVAAQRALDALDLVGVHAEIDDFVAMLGARLGWPAGVQLERVNVTQRRDESPLSQASRRRLDEILAPDLAVYEHALKRFRDQRREAIQGAPRRSFAPTAATVPAPVKEPRDIGDRRVEFTSVSASGSASGPGLVMVGEALTLVLEFVAHETISDVATGFLIRDERGLPVFGTNSWSLGRSCTIGPGKYRATFSLLNRMECGAYTIDVSLSRNGSPYLGCHHLKEQACRFDVHDLATPYFHGRVMMDPSVDFASLSPDASIHVADADAAMPRPALSTGRFNPALSDYRARLRPLQTIDRTPIGTELLVELDLGNNGTQSWPCDGKQPVCVSYHWLDDKGEVVEFDGVRSRLPRDIAPGETIRVVAFVRAPQRAGALRLRWTLVQEGVAWFDGIDTASAATMDVLVT